MYWLIFHEDDYDGAWRADSIEDLEAVKWEVGYYDDPTLPIEFELVHKDDLCPHHIQKILFCPWCKPGVVLDAERVRDDVNTQALIDEARELQFMTATEE